MMISRGILSVGACCRRRGVTLATVAVLVAAALHAGGCGTILGGTSVIYLNTNPPGAMAYVDSRPVGRTPIRVRVSTDREHQIAFRARGYLPVQQTLYRSINVGWVLLDILWFPIGVVVDAITGKWGYFPQTNISVSLRRSGYYRAPTPGYGRQPYGHSTQPPPTAPPTTLPPSTSTPPPPASTPPPSP